LRQIVCFLLVLAMWLVLTWNLDAQVVFAGVLVSLMVAAFLGRTFGRNPQRIFNPRRWLFLILYVPYFLWYCIKANFDVAYRVIHPDLPIRPGIVKVSTTLTTDLAKTFLANSITLTPGTLTVDIDGQDLYVHWINISTDDPAERTAIIVKRFEGMLRRIFE